MNSHFIPYHNKFSEMNTLGKSRTPFTFLIDFDAELIHINKVEDKAAGIQFFINPVHRPPPEKIENTYPSLHISAPPDRDRYFSSIEKVKKEIRAGNTYLLNYTDSIEVTLEHTTLKEIFAKANAPFKFIIPNTCVCFSPEEFITIQGNTISTHPMKGTSESGSTASLQALLNDKKEIAEHYTIVDLLRNDISIVAENVGVNKFRYPSKIEMLKGSIWQTSSEICGTLKAEWQARIGDILYRLLPAGSVTGAPKQKTVELIHQLEQHKRNYYTGIFGIFTGDALYSAVAIRYIEKVSNKYYYKSGGGITSMSDARREYNEMLKKIYIPLKS